MDIKFAKQGTVSGEVTITIEKADYEEKVNAALKDLRKKANLPGFRPGQVPMGLLKKRFGTEVTVEQVNKVLGEKLYEYIRNEKINMLGEPLVSENNQPEVDFENQSDFTFVFDIALAPEFDAKLTDKDELDFYAINVEDSLVDQQIQSYTTRHGEYKSVDEYQSRDMVKGTLVELDKSGKKKREGLVVENATMLPGYMKDDAEKAKFDGAKVKGIVVFNPTTAYAGNEVELASLLQIQKEEVANYAGDFRFEIAEIKRYEPAALDQKLFDIVLGEGVVTTEEEFRGKIREQLAGQFEKDSEFKFLLDLRSYLTNRIGKLTYPDELLKRIMRANNKDKDEKFVEDNYAESTKELTWHLIKEQLADQFEVKLDSKEVTNAAKDIVKMQFAQYGMANAPENLVKEYAANMLKNESQAQSIVNSAVEKKIAHAAKALVKLNQKSVTLDEFNKMFSEAE